MLISWMAYATLLGALLAGGGFALERAVGVWGRARRGVWLTALVLVTVTPLTIALRPSIVPPRLSNIIDQRVSVTLSPRGGAADVADVADVADAAGTHVTRRRMPTLPAATVFARLTIPAAWLPPLVRWTRYAAAAWAALSLLMFALFIRGVLIVRSRRKTWRDAALDGSRVLIADDVGPAVVGVVHPVVVIPTWALDLGDDERTLMLRHEREHVDAGDPVLLLVAAFAIIAFPWNAAVWFLARRLRLAIEIDCDARVLRAVGRPREYGMLLLAVGSRRTMPLPLTASLAERRPLLERRILAMTNVRPAHPILVSSPFIAIACTAAAIAAQTPLPAAPPAPAAPASAAAPATPPAWRSDLSFDSRVTPAMPATPAAPPSRTVPPTVSPVPASPVSRPAVATPAESPVAPTALAEPPAAPPRHSAPSAPREIPIEVIRGWIARYHPSILVGDTSIAVVTVVVGANDEYISSVTDKLPDNVQGDVAILDPMAGLRVEGIENIELLKGAAAAAEYGPDALNGVVVVTTKSGLADPARAMRDTGAAKSVARLVRLRLPEEQTAKIGHDPIYIVDGVLVNPQPAQTPSSNAGASLERIGVPSDGIGSVEILKLAPGRIGPNALRVVLVKLRGRG